VNLIVWLGLTGVKQKMLDVQKIALRVKVGNLILREVNKMFGDYHYLVTKGTKDFYVTGKNQIVEFDYHFEEHTRVCPELRAGEKFRPIAKKSIGAVTRGKFLRNGRCFDTRKQAQDFLLKYVKHTT
jgi:hypothetical protein